MPDVRGVAVPSDAERVDDLRTKVRTWSQHRQAFVDVPDYSRVDIQAGDLSWLCDMADEALIRRDDDAQSWPTPRMQEIVESVNTKLPPGERMTVPQVREVLRWLGDTVEEAR